MKPHCSARRHQAMTLIELVVVIFVIAILALVFLPALRPAKHHYTHITCANNVMQVLLAEKIWAGDNNDKFPMTQPVANGGCMELMNTPDAWKVFQVMSNELSSTRILRCPEDSGHQNYATNWGEDLKNKISYFIGVDAAETDPMAMMSGDDNFLLNNVPAGRGLINAGTNSLLTWDASRHSPKNLKRLFTWAKNDSGNIGFADGSVQAVNNTALQNYLQRTGFATNRFFVP